MKHSQLIPESTPQIPPSEELLHPLNWKGREILRKTGTVPLHSTSQTKVQWNQETLAHIARYLRDGAPESLATVLAQNPLAMVHPLVFWQVVHLRQLARTMDEQEARTLQELGGSLGPHGQVIPAEVKKGARHALKTILQAWVPQVLPGHTIARTPKRIRRGAKPKWSEDEVKDLLCECHDLLGKMKTWPAMEFRRKSQEPSSQFLERTYGLVQKVNEASLRSQDVHIEEPLLENPSSTNWLATLKNCRVIKTTVPLPLEVVQRVTRYAIQEKRVSKRRLVYSFLALFEQTTPKAMQRLIERAEEDYPDILKGL